MSVKNEQLEELNPAEFRHVVPLQLRFNDMDALGHINNNAQFALFDVGKVEFYNSLRGKLEDWRQVEAVIVNINCTFIEQIGLNYPMEVRTRVKAIGEKSFTLQQVLFNTESGRICTVCESVMVCIDWATKKSKPIADNILKGLKEWE